MNIILKTRQVRVGGEGKKARRTIIPLSSSVKPGRPANKIICKMKTEKKDMAAFPKEFARQQPLYA